MGWTADNSIVNELISEIERHAGHRLIIGMAGPPGSGKSTLATHLVEEINKNGDDSAIVLPMDGFHLSNFQLAKVGLARIKGAPETFDVTGFIATLSRIRAPSQDPVYVPGFDRVLDEPIAASIAVTRNTRTILVEGNYILLESDVWRTASHFLDRAWFLDVGWDVCRDRLIARHMAGGRSVSAAAEFVDRSDKANYELIVNHSRKEGVRLIK